MTEARRPSEEVLLEALRLNDKHVQGLTRLDQQLIYVPLAVMAGAISQATPHKIELSNANVTQYLGLLIVVTVILVVAGLARNQVRHGDLLADRAVLRRQLALSEEPRRLPLATGRAIYALLFVVGMVGGGYTLGAILRY